MIDWILKIFSSTDTKIFYENIYWCWGRCDSVIHNNVDISCNITACISAPDPNQAFEKMLDLAKDQYPELINREIYPEESYTLYCKDTGHFFAGSTIDESKVDIVDVDWITQE
jgi:hypothetical protein